MNSIKILLIMIFLFAAVNLHAQVVVIANKSVPENAVDIDKLEQIYLLKEKAWSNGNAIIPFSYKEDTETVEKFYSALGNSHSKMKKKWMKIQLTGEGIAPKAFGSENEMVSMVASTSGAIGFVDASKVSDKVKVLFEIK